MDQACQSQIAAVSDLHSGMNEDRLLLIWESELGWISPRYSLGSVSPLKSWRIDHMHSEEYASRMSQLLGVRALSYSTTSFCVAFRIEVLRAGDLRNLVHAAPAYASPFVHKYISSLNLFFCPERNLVK